MNEVIDLAVWNVVGGGVLFGWTGAALGAAVSLAHFWAWRKYRDWPSRN